MTDFSDYPAKLINKVRSVPGKVEAAVHNAKVGAARQIGYAGLESSNMSNPLTRGAVNAAAEMNPGGTAAAGLVALMKSKPAGFKKAAEGTFDRAKAAIAPHVTPTFNAIDKAEKAVGDRLEKTVGIRGPGDLMQKGARAAASIFSSLKSKPAAAPAKPPATKPKSEPAAKEVPMVSKGAAGKQAGNGDVKEYERYDPRAGRMVKVGGYTRNRVD